MKEFYFLSFIDFRLVFLIVDTQETKLIVISKFFNSLITHFLIYCKLTDCFLYSFILTFLTNKQKKDRSAKQ